MGNTKWSWLMTFLDVSHAITKTPTKCTSQWILLGNQLSFGWCLLCLSCPGEIKFQSRAPYRAYCTSQKERHATKPVFLALLSLLSWGWTQLTSRQVTELSLTNAGINTRVLCKLWIQVFTLFLHPTELGVCSNWNTCLNILLYQPVSNVRGSQHIRSYFPELCIKHLLEHVHP